MQPDKYAVRLHDIVVEQMITSFTGVELQYYNYNFCMTACKVPIFPTARLANTTQWAEGQVNQTCILLIFLPA